MHSWLNYLNLSDEYERRARFIPAALSLLPLFLLVPILGIPLTSWFSTLLGGTGIAAILSVALSHMASAFGNRLQEHLWPRWPHDSPTNTWLNPIDTTISTQQKKIWYSAIIRLTGLNIESAAEEDNHQELEAVINDAVARLRNRLWQSDHAQRLKIHNRDYGFARNLTGLRLVWLGIFIIATATHWIAYGYSQVQFLWPIVSTIATVLAFILAFSILPGYVRKKAQYYAETFFAAVQGLDQSLK